MKDARWALDLQSPHVGFYCHFVRVTISTSNSVSDWCVGKLTTVGMNLNMIHM